MSETAVKFNDSAALSIDTANLREYTKTLHAGMRVLLSGTVYTARDAAHKRFAEIIASGGKLPFELDGAVIYYAGPTPSSPGKPIGSCGPTTSGRMDGFAPDLLDRGLAGMIGKGERSEAVREAIIRNNAVYFAAIGGAGALAAASVLSCEVIAFPELGCESVKRLVFKDFPLIVANDCSGGDIFSKK
ncbi:MAG: FumA C-terminus/TtdB family hydratase beta subunit [Ruminococcus sp.]|jgi:fumarate hydratase subunit beta|nr:FumA C-terminus/TtdB family hydratase beta subunit [Ruminococcus sp.]